MANASRSSWATNLYRQPGRTPACSFLTQASSSIAARRLLPGPTRLYARILATLLVGLLDTPNGGPGVEADQLAALDNNASVANPKQHPVCVGGRSVSVAHPDALSNPGLAGISFSDIVTNTAASLRGRQQRLQHSEAFAPQHVREIEREVRLASRQASILTSQRQSPTAWSAAPRRVARHRARSSTDPPFAFDAAPSLR
jgi:hypothetical protein